LPALFQEENIKVPDDIALVGFSNLDLTDLLSPSLTVVRQPAFEMGQLSTELLISRSKANDP
jgi:DNA-binding LacI/PurR family transcriptional regulator